ncbi:hypothetical protein EDB81DRAFT_814579 [Dactylonectria macrodidyma]|uniref:Nephrocystin 3-like N-terminal domain-containing protein n=1 Tax=Dactylonectria macrodidyma TaxID=307937 RepID=A0A9P9IIN4_9HYPO|nr:hypothetical protein EDB81DRAFT_814579 [Dactylonectria macrodidyma]
MAKRLHSPGLYTIGWIAALPIERAAATALLDNRHETPQDFDQLQSDTNSYTWGRMGQHNIVIASLPSGLYGIVSAATTASNLISSLPHIRIGLLVGIGGAIGRPHHGRDIRLGDIVVSQPDGTTGGVVQYDLGKAKVGETWERKGSLNMPPPVLLQALAKLQAEHEIADSRVTELLQAMWTANPRMAKTRNKVPGFTHQGSQNDRLFNSSYTHVEGDSCDQCDPDWVIEREERDTTNPEIHYGIIASGNTLVKDASTRDSIAKAAGKECICFEMEAAGLMNSFPCLVIRGICDYADSHKNDRWQRYASATAAAYAKELLSFVPTLRLEATRPAAEFLGSIFHALDNIELESSNTRNEVRETRTAVLDANQRAVLDRLPVAAGASFDSHAEEGNPTCLPNTRVELLEQIVEWSKNPLAKPIFWLNGMAGTGKSTISRTIARTLAQSGHLGASFFFKRAEGDRGTSTQLFTTIASQIAARKPTIAPHIKQAIDADSAITDKGLQEQLNKLIVQPLAAISPNSVKNDPIVVLIDALDECEAEESKIKFIIHLFGQAQNLGLKIFITSRPELPIRLGFNSIKDNYQDIILHEIPEPVIKHDLSVFFEHELMRIRTEYNLSTPIAGQLLADWPGQPNLQCLVDMAIPLFIFASTVCRFLADRRCGTPDEKLREVLRFRTRTQERQLDATYLPVLKKLVVGLSSRRRNGVLQQFQQIVGSIINLMSPLSTTTLAKLLSISQSTIDNHLSMLHSVLSIPESTDSPVRLLHLSFRDFLLGPDIKTRTDFWIDGTLAHTELAAACLRVMISFLREDICGLRSSRMEGSTIESDMIGECISAELQYACLHWVSHLRGSQRPVKDDGDAISFLTEHLLHWVEVLGLMRRAREGVAIIQSLQTLVDVELGSMASSLLDDVLRILQANFPVINAAPLQVYSSVLLFAPRTSFIKNHFKSAMPSWITLPPQTERDWDQCISTFEGNYYAISYISFSHDSRLVISGSSDKTIRLWDTETGGYILSLEGYYGSVESIAISRDSEFIASYSSGTTTAVIRLWNVDTGECIKELKADRCNRCWLGFSQGSDLVASFSTWNRTIWQRYLNTGEIAQPLAGFDGPVEAVAFSRDLALTAASAADSHSIWVWSTGADSPMRELKGDRNTIKYLVFSEDSTLLASTSCNVGVRLWRVSTGKCVRELFLDNRDIRSLAISPNSQLVAYSVLRDIWLWRHDINERVCVKLKGYSPVGAITFSHDSTRLVSGSKDGLIRLWRTNASKNSQKLVGHDGEVHLITVSPDSALIASSSWKDIRLWRSETGEFIQKLEGHTRQVNSLAFSHDSALMVSSSDDATVRLWSMNPGSLGACLGRFWGLDRVNSAVVSHDAAFIASAAYESACTIHLWNLKTGERIKEFPIMQFDPTYNSIALSHDSTLLASASYRNIVTLWHTDTGRCVQILQGHKNIVTSVAFSQDSKIVAVASKDGSVWLWRVDTGECMQQLEIGVASRRLLFEPRRDTLLTDIGQFSAEESGSAYRQTGYGLSSNYCWITWKGKRLLWLPAEYRPRCSVTSGATVAYGCASGRVFVLRFSDYDC